MNSKLRRAIALTAGACLITVSAPRRTEANPLAIPAAGGCIASVGCVIGVVIVGGVVYWVITENGRTDQVAIGPAIPVIDDPEAETEQWEEYIWAESQAQAERKCEAIAEAATWSGGRRVTVKRVQKFGRGRYGYKCVLEGEVE